MPDYPKDSLGSRMKEQYENRFRFMVPRRTYTIIRVDGKAFHTLTAKCKRPYDTDFMAVMDKTTVSLMNELQGSKLGFVQSDEISILLTDFDKPETCAAFDGNLQKLCSVSAAIATASFNRNSTCDGPPNWGWGLFDSRVFIIPDPVEVENYFIWRQKDSERNSVVMLAQHYASHRELLGKSRTEQMDIIYNAGDNWNHHPAGFKRGRVVVNGHLLDAPIFTDDRPVLSAWIPRQWAESGK